MPVIPIPVGSCTYQLQELFDLIKNIPLFGDIICNKYLPGNGCDLPMLPGHYGGAAGGDDAITIDIPPIPDIIYGYLTGTFDITLEIYNEEWKELVCTKTTIEVTQ